MGDGLPIDGAARCPPESLPGLLAEAPRFEGPPGKCVPEEERRQRLSVVRSVLDEAARASAGRTAGSAASGTLPENRWSPYAELCQGERAAACRETLSALEP